VRQRQAARTGMALTVLAAGVPMFTGGDEILRSQRCNNNTYNLDSPGNWLDWNLVTDALRFQTFTRRLLALRAAHPALRPTDWRGSDRIAWRRADGQKAEGAYMDDPAQHVLAWRLGGPAAGDGAPAIFVAYNGGNATVPVKLPPLAAGGATRWYSVADTSAWLEDKSNIHAPGSEHALQGDKYDLGPRSLAIFIEK